MKILDILFAVILVAASFFCGACFSDYFNRRAHNEQRAALERQYLRIQAGSDADDPCRPYVYTRPTPVVQNILNPVDNQFMDELHSRGRAKKKFRKSDLTA